MVGVTTESGDWLSHRKEERIATKAAIAECANLTNKDKEVLTSGVEAIQLWLELKEGGERAGGLHSDGSRSEGEFAMLKRSLELDQEHTDSESAVRLKQLLASLQSVANARRRAAQSLAQVEAAFGNWVTLVCRVVY